MEKETKEDTVRIVIVDVPKSHVRKLRIKAAIDGHRFMSPYLRKLLKEWAEKQGKD